MSILRVLVSAAMLVVGRSSASEAAGALLLSATTSHSTYAKNARVDVFLTLTNKTGGAINVGGMWDV